jgi:UDP-apiose/xylose synthase
MPERRIAVLGAGGFLGSHLVPALLQRHDCDIDAVDIHFEKLETRDRRVQRVSMRVEDPRCIEQVVDRCSVILSLTALCNPALYSTKPLEVIDASYTHLIPLVKACAARGKRLIHFSTCEVYGRAALDFAGQPMTEMSEEHTGLFLGAVDRERWTYACAKQLLERVIWAHGRHGGLDFTIIRPFNVIGSRMDFLPGVDGDGIPRVLASFMNALLRGEELCLVDGGPQRRSFISAEDFVLAVSRVVERAAVCRREILNVGNPANNVSIRELGEALARAFASRMPGAPPARFRDVSAAELYGAGYDDTPDRIPDIRKANRLLEWSPQTTIAQMLPAIVDDYVLRYAHLVKSDGRRPERQGNG